MPQIYKKHHLSSTDLLDHLASRGLVIPDRQSAQRTLEEIGYHRLRIYCLSRRDPAALNRQFYTGTTFENIVQLYRFDEKLRSICFEACARLEIVFCSAVSEALCQKFGPHPHLKPLAFATVQCRLDATKMMFSVCSEKQEKDSRLMHYYQKYDDPPIAPFWIIKELFTFGQMIRFYDLLSNEMKKLIADKMSIPSWLVLLSWLKCCLDLRNMCAHHDRVFNHSFRKRPINLKKPLVPSTKQKDRIAALLYCVDYILQRFDPSISYVDALKNLLLNFPAARPSDVGI